LRRRHYTWFKCGKRYRFQLIGDEDGSSLVISLGSTDGSKLGEVLGKEES